MPNSNLEIYNRMFHLYDKKIHPVLKNYPKFERPAMVNDMRVCFLEYLTYVSRANRVKSKRLVYSQEAEAYLDKIKTLMMLSRNKKYIGKNFYEEISLELTEVSKMLAGYMRAINKR